MKNQLKIDIIPKTFKLQWHITERCNFRCRHCYQDNFDTPEMLLNQMEYVLAQFTSLLKKWQIPPSNAFLTITGGEPFLYRDFFSFLAKVYKYSASYQWAILSNGSMVNQENAKILKLFKISGYQISLEGLEDNNDGIRGKGNFKKAFESLRILVEIGIPTMVSLTVTQKNIDDIFPLAKLISDIGVNIFWVRRFVPGGEGSGLVKSLLEPSELSDLYRKIEKVDHDLFKKGSTLRILPGCENGFLWLGAKGTYCGVLGGRILTLMPNGDIYPCRRLPVKLGNILETPLEEIYYSDRIREIRSPESIPEYCRGNCPDFNNCLGGAKCVTYAYSGRLDIPDVQCLRAYSKLDENICRV